MKPPGLETLLRTWVPPDVWAPLVEPHKESEAARVLLEDPYRVQLAYELLARLRDISKALLRASQPSPVATLVGRVVVRPAKMGPLLSLHYRDVTLEDRD